jgi:hypothetical protein
MPFKDPRTERPRDGQRVHFKVTGDPEIAKVKEPAIAHFRSPVAADGPIGYLGAFIHETTGHTYHLWEDSEDEIAGWRPVEEFHRELQ